MPVNDDEAAVAEEAAAAAAVAAADFLPDLVDIVDGGRYWWSLSLSLARGPRVTCRD